MPIDFQPIQPEAPKPPSQIDFTPMPKVPNMSGVQGMAQKNLSIFNSENQDEKSSLDNPSDRLDTAMGFPVSRILASSNKNFPYPPEMRENLVSAYRSGSATSAGDFMQSAIHSIAPMLENYDFTHSMRVGVTDAKKAAGHYFDEVGKAIVGGGERAVGTLAYPFLSGESRQKLIESGALGDVPELTGDSTHDFIAKELTLANALLSPGMGAAYTTVAAPLAPVISPLIEGAKNISEKAGVSHETSSLIPPTAEFLMNLLGAKGVGVWDNVAGGNKIKQVIAEKTGKSSEQVTAQDIDSVIASSFDHLPAKQHFQDVATIMKLENPDTLHTIYAKTGIEPAQVFEDARGDVSIAEQVSKGEIPEAYEQLLPKLPKVEETKPLEDLSVRIAEDNRGFDVVDKDGDFVDGGFDSYADAKYFISEKIYEQEERAAIQAIEALEEKSIKANLPKTEKTVQGEQTVISGAEKITDKQLAERQMEKPLQAEVPQKPADEGLFDVSSRKQSDLFERQIASPKIELPKNRIMPPSEVGRPTSLRTFLKNNGIKLNENNEVISAKRDGKTISGEQALEIAHEMAKDNGYMPIDDISKPSSTSREIADLLSNSNGGRQAFRIQDAERVAKMDEAILERMRSDPAYIEDQAYKAGIDTDRLPGESEKKFTKRMLNELQKLYKNSEGSAAADLYRATLGNIIKLGEKAVGKLTGNLFHDLGEIYIKVFQPELMGPKALRADAFLAKNKTAIQEAENAIILMLKDMDAKFAKRSKDSNLEWIYDHETGRWTERDNPDHALYQSLTDSIRKAELESGVPEYGYKHNYLPLVFKDVEGVKKYFSSEAFIKKYGFDGFTKQRSFDLIQDAVRAGYELKTYNPIQLLKDRLLAGRELIAFNDLMKDFAESKLAVPARAFTVDKRIGKVASDLEIAKNKYKEASDKINDSQQTAWNFAEPAISKYMERLESRIENLKSKLEEYRDEKVSYNLSAKELSGLKDNSFKIIAADGKVWSLDNELGAIWKNAMDSKGLWERQDSIGDFYRSGMEVKSNWIKSKLAISLFHPVHEVMIHLATGIDMPAYHLLKGGKFSDLQFRDTALHMGLGKEGVSPFRHDHQNLIDWNTPAAERTPEQAANVQRMIEGGFVPTVSAKQIAMSKENWNKAIDGIGANNLRLIGAAADIVGKPSQPLFEHWIPALRSDAYNTGTRLALERDPTLANDAGRRGEVFRRIAKDIDRNYGEMNKKALFWNKTVKDIADMCFLSAGWKLAMLQNFRGLLAPAKIAYDFAKTGEFSKDAITYQILHSYTYTMLTLMTGAMMKYMFTGTFGNLTDWISPDTGDKKDDGTPLRLSQPAFAKEMLMLFRDINQKGVVSGTGEFLYHQSLIPGIAETLTNQDFVGRKIISDPTDLRQWANAGWDFVSPITISSYENADRLGSKTAKLAQLAGFPVAGAYINQSQFEQKVLYEYSKTHSPKDDVYTAKLKSELKGAVRNNDAEKQEDIKNKLKEQMQKKGMDDEAIRKAIDKAATLYKEPFVDYAWTQLSKEKQLELIESASEEEKEQTTKTGKKRFKIKY